MLTHLKSPCLMPSYLWMSAMPGKGVFILLTLLFCKKVAILLLSQKCILSIIIHTTNLLDCYRIPHERTYFSMLQACQINWLYLKWYLTVSSTVSETMHLSSLSWLSLGCFGYTGLSNSSTTFAVTGKSGHFISMHLKWPWWDHNSARNYFCMARAV